MDPPEHVFILGSKKDVTMLHLARNAISLTKLQQGLHNTDAPFPTTRWIADEKILRAKAITLTTLIWTLHRSLNLLARMSRPHDLAPHRQGCRFGASSNASGHGYHPKLSDVNLQGTILPFLFWQAAIQRNSGWPLRLSSARRPSLCSRPAYLLLRDCSCGTPLILTADSYHRNTV